MPVERQLPSPDDILGEEIGKFTCVKRLYQRKDRNWMYLIRCECGHEFEIDRGNFLLGNCSCPKCSAKKVRKHRTRLNPYDILGKRFGRLTVMEYQGTDSRYKHTYLCKCDCGCQKIIVRNNLISGQTKSCGCGKKIDPMDIVGKQFGEWTVLFYLGKEKGIHFYKCQCSCGEIKEVSRKNLISGRSKSCGHEKDLWIDPVKENPQPYPDDIIGERINDLTCIKRLGKDQIGNWIYLCRCQCGKKVRVDRGNFLLGTFPNCGRCKRKP